MKKIICIATIFALIIGMFINSRISFKEKKAAETADAIHSAQNVQDDMDDIMNAEPMDKVTMGVYDGHPMVWTVMYKDEDGSTTLWLDNVVEDGQITELDSHNFTTQSYGYENGTGKLHDKLDWLAQKCFNEEQKKYFVTYSREMQTPSYCDVDYNGENIIYSETIRLISLSELEKAFNVNSDLESELRTKYAGVLINHYEEEYYVELDKITNHMMIAKSYEPETDNGRNELYSVYQIYDDYTLYVSNKGYAKTLSQKYNFQVAPGYNLHEKEEFVNSINYPTGIRPAVTLKRPE